jgi:hypothetical protein
MAVRPLASDVIGLDPATNNPNLTFIFFMAVVLLGVLGLRFAVYAHLNHRRTEIEGQARLWRLLTYVGVLSVIYGVLGVLRVLSTIEPTWIGAVMLGIILLLAFAIRQIHVTARESRAGNGELVARLGFILVVVVIGLLHALLGPIPTVAAAEGLAALVFVGYGFTFYRDQTRSSRLQGTMIDSILRHLLPVLTFAGLVSIVNVAQPFGLEPIVVLHVQVVFVVMTASAMMTATIKLRQNLASL